ncbi:MAG TPA: TIGR03621 family F420-dependent LLM class oxidoreductase [Thermomicrobiales bacterium]|nr:TIGR03621 family F420-dependent LLM class oxidoreductase [Thermomicrobiales bacterium]
MPRDFRFGVSVFQAETGEAWREKARRVEGLGFDVLLIPDHIGSELLSYAPALMAAADATTTLRVGPFVLDNNFRHPAFVARDAATIDLLSEGRYELGIGGGWLPANFERTGVPFKTAGIRAGRLEESVLIIKGLLKGEPFSFAGEHYTIAELAGFPKPVQQPLPIMMGAGGPRVLDFAAREADIIGVTPPALPQGGLKLAVEADSVDRQIARIRAAAGELFDDIELNILMQEVLVTDDRQAAAEELAAQWEKPAADLLDSPHLLIGTHEQMAEDLRQRRERFGFSYIAVFERDLDAFAPVIAKARSA